MTPPFDYRDFDSVALGVDETDGRFGEVAIETCKVCGRKWLRYFVEYEAFPRSGRWYRGLVTDAFARSVRPGSAVDVLQSLAWRFAGGDYFESIGFKNTGPVIVDPY